MQQIYELTCPYEVRQHIEWDDGVDTEKIECPIQPENHRRGGKRCTPLAIIIKKFPFPDLAKGYGIGLLAAEKALSIFQSQDFTGFTAERIRARAAYTKDEYCEIPPVYELTIHGWAGVAPPESGVKLERMCEGCGYRRYIAPTDTAKIFDEAQWDGSGRALCSLHSGSQTLFDQNISPAQSGYELKNWSLRMGHCRPEV